MEGEYNVDYDIMGRASDQLTDDISSLTSMGEFITFNLNGMDTRVSEYLKTIYKLGDLVDQFSTLSDQATGYQAWMDDAVGRVRVLDNDLAGNVVAPPKTNKMDGLGSNQSSGGQVGVEIPDVNLDIGGSDVDNSHQGEETYIDPDAFEQLPDTVQKDIRDLLRSLGYTDEEIEKILKGEMPLKPEDVEKIKDYIDDIRETDPALADQLEAIFKIKTPNSGEEASDEPGKQPGSPANPSNTPDSGTHTGSSIGGSLGNIGVSQSSVELKAAEAIASAGSLVDKLGASAKKLASKMTPYGGGSNASASANKSSAGIIAAAALAAGGAAAGGGAFVGKKLNYITFTPKDWEALGKDYQGVIKKIMKRSGLTEDEIDTFTTSTFKIATSEIKEHVDKIEKAVQTNPEMEDEFVKMYNYSLFDDQKRVIYYLLFITMIIDGRNLIDEYNMYNIINQNLENVDESDFVYSGIVMEEYFYDGKDEEKDVPIKYATGTKEDDEEEIKVIPDKEWLKGIGLDD